MTEEEGRARYSSPAEDTSCREEGGWLLACNSGGDWRPAENATSHREETSVRAMQVEEEEREAVLGFHRGEKTVG